jgi:Arc/MetJ family transcription regulator
MRTNIVLDDDLVRRAQKLTGIKTKRAVVEEALRKLIRFKEEEEAFALFGTVNWEGDLEESRRGRNVR